MAKLTMEARILGDTWDDDSYRINLLYRKRPTERFHAPITNLMVVSLEWSSFITVRLQVKLFLENLLPNDL